MNENQKTLLGDHGFCWFPYELKDAVNNHSTYNFTSDDLKSLSTMGKFWKFIKETTYIEIQNDKMTIVKPANPSPKNTLVFILNGVESIDIKLGKTQSNIKLQKSIFKGLMVGTHEFDFNNPIHSIQLNFKYDMADPLIFDVIYDEIIEPKIDISATFVKHIDATHQLGNDLINIYFNKANDQVVKTNISLYMVNLNKIERLIKNYEVEKDDMFLSISGLAYGKYAYTVQQFDKYEKLVVETNKTYFDLKMPNYSGKNISSN